MQKRAIYYFTNWSGYQRNYNVEDIPSYVSDIAYAFANINADGSVVLFDKWADVDKRYTTSGIKPFDSWEKNNEYHGNFGQFKKLLDSGRKLSLQLSIGGWTLSRNFSDAMLTSQTRTTCINSIVALLEQYKIFKGVSFDWEYLSSDGINYGMDSNKVRKEDGDNFVLFLQEWRRRFGKKYIVSMCCTAAPEKAKFPIEKIHSLIDELHVMTYDFHDGSWGETISAHHTNPRRSKHGKWSCEEAADHYIARGVPSTKIFIGAAFYSRGFANTDGLGKSAAGGSPDKSQENGIVNFSDLPIAGATVMFDQEAKASYTYDNQRRVFNSFDNRDSIIEKCKIVKEKNLGGIIIWEISYDKRGDGALSKVLHDNLNASIPQPVIDDDEEKKDIEIPKTKLRISFDFDAAKKEISNIKIE